MANLTGHLRIPPQIKPYTNQQVQEMAADKYRPQYNAATEALHYQNQKIQQALAQQLSELAAGYTRDKSSLDKQIKDSYASADRQALSRGMARSSFNNANLSNINIKGMQEQNNLAQTNALKRNELGTQRTQAQKELGQSLGRLKNDYAANVNVYANQLMQQQQQQIFEQNQAYNSLQLQLMQLDPASYGIDTGNNGGGGGGGRYYGRNGGKKDDPVPSSTFMDQLAQFGSSLSSTLSNALSNYSNNKPNKKPKPNYNPIKAYLK